MGPRTVRARRLTLLTASSKALSQAWFNPASEPGRNRQCCSRPNERRDSLSLRVGSIKSRNHDIGSNPVTEPVLPSDLCTDTKNLPTDRIMSAGRLIRRFIERRLIRLARLIRRLGGGRNHPVSAHIGEEQGRVRARLRKPVSGSADGRMAIRVDWASASVVMTVVETRARRRGRRTHRAGPRHSHRQRSEAAPTSRRAPRPSIRSTVRSRPRPYRPAPRGRAPLPSSHRRGRHHLGSAQRAFRSVQLGQRR